MNKLFYLFIILCLIGCTGPVGKPDITDISIEERADSTEDTEIITAVETKTFFSDDTEIDIPDYIYTAYAKGFPDYRFTIETYVKKRGYSTYLHLEKYNMPYYDRNTYKTVEPSPTVIKAALYHGDMVHFVGTNGSPVWKYQYVLSAFPRVNTATPDWNRSDEKGSIDDIIAAPNNGYYIALNTLNTYGYDYSFETEASIAYLSDIDSWPRYSGIGRDIEISKLLLYENRLVVFGKKDNQLFFSVFAGNVFGYWIIEKPFYYYDFPFRILSVSEQNESFYVRGIDKDNVQTIRKFDNPYVSIVTP